jgi:hypothetical protein
VSADPADPYAREVLARLASPSRWSPSRGATSGRRGPWRRSDCGASSCPTARHSRFAALTTLARFGDRFHPPNARFTVPSPVNAGYTVVSTPA